MMLSWIETLASHQSQYFKWGHLHERLERVPDCRATARKTCASPSAGSQNGPPANQVRFPLVKDAGWMPKLRELVDLLVSAPPSPLLANTCSRRQSDFNLGVRALHYAR